MVTLFFKIWQYCAWAWLLGIMVLAYGLHSLLPYMRFVMPH